MREREIKRGGEGQREMQKCRDVYLPFAGSLPSPLEQPGRGQLEPGARNFTQDSSAGGMDSTI